MIYYLSLGGNVGHRRKYLLQALNGLKAFGSLQAVSSLYESAPFGVRNQRFFLNLVCTLESSLRPFRLLGKIKALETQLGRQRSHRWGPREIDIDLIDWSGPSIRSGVLNLPHRGLPERLFVLIPLQEIAPSFRDRQGRHIASIIKRCPTQDSLKRIL